jgi:hypothetical protein
MLLDCRTCLYQVLHDAGGAALAQPTAPLGIVLYAKFFVLVRVVVIQV